MTKLPVVALSAGTADPAAPEVDVADVLGRGRAVRPADAYARAVRDCAGNDPAIEVVAVVDPVGDAGPGVTAVVADRYGPAGTSE